MPDRPMRPRKIERTNAPGTCLWCGRVLSDSALVLYGAGFFERLACAEKFAAAMAKAGKRLANYKGEE